MELQQVGLETALGTIVFGPHTNDLAGIGHTIDMLRRAAGMLEYRYAEVRRMQQSVTFDASGQSQQRPMAEQHGEQLAPAKRKRKHRATTRATNGAATPGQATHEPPPPEIMFPPEGAVE